MNQQKGIFNMNQIITSLLETDMYKFSMGQAIYHQFSDYKTTWSFKCRNKNVIGGWMKQSYMLITFIYNKYYYIKL